MSSPGLYSCFCFGGESRGGFGARLSFACVHHKRHKRHKMARPFGTDFFRSWMTFSAARRGVPVPNRVGVGVDVVERESAVRKCAVSVWSQFLMRSNLSELLKDWLRVCVISCCWQRCVFCCRRQTVCRPWRRARSHSNVGL